MAKRTKPKLGDPVIVYGNIYQVSGFRESLVDHATGEHRTVVDIIDANGRARREKAIREMKVRREAQVDLSHGLRAEEPKAQEKWEKLRAEIEELNKVASEAFGQFSLRLDFFHYWTQRGWWYTEGRVLSDHQHEAYRQLNGGKKVDAVMQRAAYDILEEKGLLVPQEG